MLVQQYQAPIYGDFLQTLSALKILSGTHLWGFSSNPVGPEDIIRGGRGRSSSHSGQELTISGICFMELICGWRGAALSVHPKDDLLE